MSFENPAVVEGAKESLVDRIESDVVIPGEDHEDLWVHPEVVSIPGDPIVCELRAHKTDRNGKDRHEECVYFRTEDDFRSLQPIERPGAHAWKRTGLRPNDIDTEHPDASGTVLPADAYWSWYMHYIHLDPETIVQPLYSDIKNGCRSVRTVVARVKGERAVLLHVSNPLTNNYARGFLEPHLVECGGRCYLTVRAEDGRGYVASSENGGRFWNSPVPWRWDNGEEIAMHTTMTKLVPHSEGLALVYTRIREDNKEYFRSRTPLHMADIDTEDLTLRRNTERIIVPNRSEKTGTGARSLGNFWIWPINSKKSYVAVGEWMRDGSRNNGNIWLSKIYWKKPNQQMTSDGIERRNLR